MRAETGEHHASKRKGLAWLLGAMALGAVVAGGLAPFARAVPWSWERRLGAAIAVDSTPSACPKDAQAQAALQKVLSRLYPLDDAERARPLELRLRQDASVNAFASLGGRLCVNSGLLKEAQSPEELAGVLAHEIEHAVQRHVMQGALVQILSWQGLSAVFGGGGARLGQALLNMDFTKAQEAKADEGGLKRLQRAGVDTAGLRQFFERMQKEHPNGGWFSDHPADEDRIAMAAQHPTAQPRPVLDAAEWAALKACR